MSTLQDRPAGTRPRTRHTITIEPYTEPGRPDVTVAVVERYGVGFTRVCLRNTDLRGGDTLEYAAQRLAALYEASYVTVTPAAGYTKQRDLPADCVDVGDQVARSDDDGSNLRWSTVTWVDDCCREFCPQIGGGICSGVLGFDDGTEVHFDIVDRPIVRIPVEVTE